MAWGMEAVLLAAPYVYSGVTGLISGSKQADNYSAYSIYNAQAISDAGDASVNSLLATGEIKSAMKLAAAKSNIKSRAAINKYNADQSFLIGQVNSGLLEQEARLVWEQAGLDIQQLDKSFASTIGRMRVNHGASGAIMDQDASLQAQDAAQDVHEMQKFIVRRGADIRAGKLLNQAAISEWRGTQEANRIVFEGALLGQSEMTNASVSAYGDVVQAFMDASMVDYNTNVKTFQTLALGSQQSANASTQGTSSFVSGLFGAATSVGATYLRNKIPVTSDDSLLVSFGDRTSVPGGMGGV